MLILAAIAALWIKNAALDFGHMATGRTPPSHAYRMARLREQAAKRRRAFDPDTRGGLGMVARHWYLDACEDLDHWRAHRHATKPERRAARQRRREAREGFTARWGWRKEDPMPEDIVDAEIVDETKGFTPDPDPPPAAATQGPGRARPGRTSRRTTRTTATSSTVTEEEARPAPGTDVAVVTPDEQGVRPPLPHRRMVLMTMLATAGYDPDVEAIGGMDEDQVDAAIEALIAHERAARSASHTY
ncbi:hypothetical protein EMG21_28785 [Klebsiella pneumoniae]|nr:hypothetical protein EMG21_28785 [Klebsiella pneumoniae]